MMRYDNHAKTVFTRVQTRFQHMQESVKSLSMVGGRLTMTLMIITPLLLGPGSFPELVENRPLYEIQETSRSEEAVTRTDTLQFSGLDTPQKSEYQRSMSEIFVQNVGQFDPQAEFVVRGITGDIIISKQGIWTTIVEFSETERGIPASSPLPSSTPQPGSIFEGEDRQPLKGVNLRFSFPGANADPRIEGFGEIDSTISYITGDKSQDWFSDVPVWSGVRYVDLYPGVDLELTIENGEWIWKLIYKPQLRTRQEDAPFTLDSEASPPDLQDVRLRIEGAKRFNLEQSDLQISTVVGDLYLPLLELKVIDGANQPKQALPIIDGDEIVAPFEQSSNSDISPNSYSDLQVMSAMGARFAPLPLSLLDSINAPTQDLPQDFIFSTLLGGGDDERGMSIAVDEQGATYITGYTFSSDFPTTPGAFNESCNACYGTTDAFITKVTPEGTGLVYSTFIGGTNHEEGHSITVDTDGFAFVTGHTSSSDFPTTVGAYDASHNGSPGANNAFALKLTTDGTGLVYSTYLGPNSQGLDIDLDANGSAYISGQAFSADFPTTSGAYDQTHNGKGDGFVIKLDPTGSSLLYSTYLGGSGVDCEVGGVLWECSIAVDEAGAAYISGMTNSSDFPTTSGAWDTSYGGNQDAFVSKLSPDGGSLIYSTFLGGSLQECLLSCTLDIDDSGAAYVTGATQSDDIQSKFDVDKNPGWDSFVAKLTPAGDDLVYFAYFGGTQMDFAHNIVVNPAGEAIIVGETYSSDFPTTDATYQTCASCPTLPDAFIYKLDATGSQVTYSTYLGGSDHDLGISIDTDDAGVAYVTGKTDSPDFPISPNVIRPRNANVFISAIAVGIGSIEITSAEYRFPASVDSDILGDRETEIWARMYRPAELTSGPYPLLVLLHGNHATCGMYNPLLGIRVDRSVEYTLSGTCPLLQTVVPNHEGYGYLAEPLASVGYIVVSINANRGITGGSSASGDPNLILARGRLVLKHLQLLQEWNTSGSAPESLGLGGDGLIGKIDFNNVGFMGHSRGGEGVRAAYNMYGEPGSDWQDRISNMEIKAIFEIAPVDRQAPETYNALDTVWNVLLPMCDGDVSNLQGVRPFDRMLQVTSEASPSQNSSFTVWGANHNFFNTEWQKSDSEICLGEANDRLFGARGESAQQQTVALEAVEALMLGNVGAFSNSARNQLFNPLSDLPSELKAITRVERGFTQSPDSSLTWSIEDFSGPTGTNQQAGESIPNGASNIAIQHGPVPRHDPTQRAGVIAWSSAGQNTFFQTNWTSSGSGNDVSSYSTLDLRVSRQDSDLNPSGGTDFSIRLVTADNSLSDPVQLSDHLELLGPVGGPGGLHPILQTVRIPLSEFTNTDLNNFRGVRITFDHTIRGAIYVANIQLSKKLGTSLVRNLFPDVVLTTANWSSVQSSVETRYSGLINLFSLSDEGAIEILLHNPAGFPIRDAVPLVRIGDEYFNYSGFVDGSATTMSFTLSADQFANQEDGVPITFLFGPYEYEPIHHYGLLEKASVEDGQIFLLQKPRMSKEVVIQDLEQLSGDPGGDQIESAVLSLTLSISPDYWLDASHLNPTSGGQVFGHEIDAIEVLVPELGNPDSTLDKARLLSIIQGIIEADRSIAAIAIEDAADEGVDPATLEEADNELLLGDFSAAEGDYSEAIKHYYKAWRIAIEAVSLSLIPAADQVLDEGEGIVLIVASFSDSPFAGDHSASIDWGDGSSPEPGIVAEEQGSGTVLGEHIYGDDGEYQVTVEVCNDAEICKGISFQIVVENLPPVVSLNTEEAISSAGGEAFVGISGITQTHEATATDPGSDDLTFGWSRDGDLIRSHTIFNNGESEDEDPSSLGEFPFTASDSVDFTFESPGLHTIDLLVSDDDSGSASASMLKLVTDNFPCTQSMGFWRHQFRGKGQQHIDDVILEGYLEIVDFASGYFSENRPATTLSEANEILDRSGPDMLYKAEAQLLSAWLNFTSGSVSWEESITYEQEDGSTLVLPFYELITRAEALLLDPDSTSKEYEQAKAYAEAINLLDDDSTQCEFDDAGSDSESIDLETEDENNKGKNQE